MHTWYCSCKIELTLRHSSNRFSSATDSARIIGAVSKVNTNFHSAGTPVSFASVGNYQYKPDQVLEPGRHSTSAET